MRTLALVLLTSLLAGCGGRGVPTPAEDRQGPPDEKEASPKAEGAAKARG